jgi:phthiocerol/phenolphthiocerol synthesis type-I polyketide synthase A
MGQKLLADEPVFAAAVAELEPVFVEQVGFSLRDVLANGEQVSGDAQVQPVVMGLQLALTALWRSHGVEPDAVIGHSMGEVTAAVVAGALSPADGLKVIATRSRLMSRLSGQGAVALLELDAEASVALIADFAGVSVAGHVSPRQTVIAGPVAPVDAVIAAVTAQDRFARRVNMEVASHTALMDPILAELRAALADLSPELPVIPFFSTVTGDATTAPLLDADYWVSNVRQPALLSQAVTAAAAEHAIFVEISAHPILAHAITETLESAQHHSIGTLWREGDDTIGFHTNLNTVHTGPPRTAPHPPEPHKVLPSAPWHHTRHWITPENRLETAGSKPRPGTLLGQHIAVATAPPTHLWQARLAPDATPYPGRHRIRGMEVVPVSVLVQTLSAVAAELDASTLADVRFEYPMVVDQPLVIQVVADNESVTVSSSPVTDGVTQLWTRHVSARVSRRKEGWSGAHDGRDHEMRADDTVSDESAAALQREWGIEGQPFEWSIGSCRSAPGALHADVGVPAASTVALLDAAVHVARLVDGSHPQPMFAVGVDSVRFDAELADDHGSIEVYRRDDDEDEGGAELVVDVAVKAPDGSTCIDIRALRYAAVESGPVPGTSRDDSHTLAHALEWQSWTEHADAQQAPDVPITLAVLGEGSAARTLHDRLAGTGYVPADVAEARCVLYVADPGPVDTAENDLDCAVRLSAEVADLVRQLARRDDDHPATLWIVTRGVREGSSEAAVRQSSLWGMAGVIRAEQPQLWGGLVDIPAGRDAEADVGDCAPALLAVLRTPAKSILALRDGEFLVAALGPVSGQPVREPLRCRPDAAYLITGGMGALGLLMAAWLADLGARRLVLAGRTPLPPRRDWDSDANDTDVRHRIAAIRALEMRGVSVDAVALDVGSRDAVQALLAGRDGDAEPPIRGVIHAAGVTEGQLLTEVSVSRLRRTMWPKIAGAQVLHEAFPPGSLDFLFLTASAGTVFGVPGQGAYASANAYLDGLARARHRQGCHTVSLDWVAWRGLGFAADAQVVLQELERVGSRPVIPNEAFTAWEHVARYDVAQAVMAPLGSADVSASDADAVSSAKLMWSQLPAEEVLSEVENGLRTILARELHMAEADFELDRPFAELGLNSVMAMSVRRETEQLVGFELSVTMLFNYPTVSSLAAYLASQILPREDSDDEVDGPPDSDGSVLDDLFDIVESAPAGSESGMA